MFHFRNERNVHLLKQWFDNVGVGNLQWLRRVRVSAASSDGARFDQQRLFDMKRTFTKCLDMFAVRCSNVQELDIKEDASHNKGCPSGSEQVLILTKVTGVKRLRLFGWTSLSAAEQMARLVVLREHSKVEVRRTQAEPTTKNPQTGCYPGWDVMFETINSTDEVAMDRALRSWEEFERILTTDRNA
ncbi:hypothetical protein MMC16_002543 [Acarospora aff. strigata]|nr:hypothetical protein [Acarospora aff. strigata]